MSESDQKEEGRKEKRGKEAERRRGTGREEKADEDDLELKMENPRLRFPRGSRLSGFLRSLRFLWFRSWFWFWLWLSGSGWPRA